jgi:hypothetical protein
MGGLSDDQSSLLKASVRNRREQREGGENGEKLFHCAILPIVRVRSVLARIYEMPHAGDADARAQKTSH